MLELIAVDGVPVGQEETGMEAKPHARAVLPPEIAAELRSVRDALAQMTSVLLAQQQELSRLNAALTTVRISRTQELALNQAIRARAQLLARTEGLPGCEKRIASAIRTTLRETTGARAVGDLQAGQFDAAMGMVCAWQMSGALRRIRRETEAGR